MDREAVGAPMGARPDIDVDALTRSIVADASDGVVVLDAGAEVVFVNAALERLLGYPAAAVLGRSIVDFLHPDDLERALLHVSGASGSAGSGRSGGSTPRSDGRSWGGQYGTTGFRVRHADGPWVKVEVSAAAVTDGREAAFAVYLRVADEERATDAVLTNLLRGRSRSQALAPVVDVFEWDLNGIDVAITWWEGGRRRWVGTVELPADLVGADGDPSVGADDPWDEARRTGRGVHRRHEELAPALAAQAERHDGGHLWIEAVEDPAAPEPALITVWGRADGRPPEGHAYGMSMARTYVALILGWTHQQDLLAAAASLDPLTGVANRATLFDAFEHAGAPGCVLFCDLDRFKPVNDDLGHLAGDEVLREVARRIVAAARPGDLVARTGGDEFVVVLAGAGRPAAEAVAERILLTVPEPVAVAGAEVVVEISIGAAEDAVAVGEAALAEADRALLAAKAAGRGVLRWAP